MICIRESITESITESVMENITKSIAEEGTTLASYVLINAILFSHWILGYFCRSKHHNMRYMMVIYRQFCLQCNI